MTKALEKFQIIDDVLLKKRLKKMITAVKEGRLDDAKGYMKKIIKNGNSTEKNCFFQF